MKYIFSSNSFSCDISTDIIGAEIGGSSKNVIAISYGICEGLDFGSNTKSYLITNGLKEISLLSLVLGGKKETIYGISGLGDLFLTCSDLQSRNKRFGLSLAKDT